MATRNLFLPLLADTEACSGGAASLPTYYCQTIQGKCILEVRRGEEGERERERRRDGGGGGVGVKYSLAILCLGPVCIDLFLM